MRKRKGQAVILALMIMLLLAVIAAVFLASISLAMGRTIRHSDIVLSGQMARAALEFASEHLTGSPEGADWRPSEPPRPGQDANGNGIDDVEEYYDDFERLRGWAPEVDGGGNIVRRGFSKYPPPFVIRAGGTEEVPPLGRGYFLLKVDFSPRPDDPLSRFIKITAIGRVVGSPTVYRKLVAYKPIGITDYLLFIANRDRLSVPAKLGLPGWVDLNGNNQYDTVTTFTSPSNQQMIDFDREAVQETFRGPIRVNGNLEWHGWNEVSLLDSDPTGLFPREDKVVVAGRIVHDESGIQAVQDVDPQVPPGGWPPQVRVNGQPASPSGPGFNNFGGRYLDADHGAPWLEPPNIFSTDPLTGRNRWEELTKFSLPLPALAPSFPNASLFGYGQGIYVDNRTDIQADTDGDGICDNFDALREEWLTGRPVIGGRWERGLYIPPGCEIVLHPNDYIVPASAQPDQAVVDPGTNTLIAPHQPGIPVIEIVRNDVDAASQRGWRLPNGFYLAGVRRAIFDYPLNGVIYCEGNVRVRGVLPPRGFKDEDRNGQADSPPARVQLPDGRQIHRPYDLVIISGGTIYIEGNILSPKDIDPLNIPEEDNTRVGLLARDFVALNMTRAHDAAAMAEAVNATPPLAQWDPGGGKGVVLNPLLRGPVVHNFSLGGVPLDTDGDNLPDVILTVWHCGASEPSSVAVGVNPQGLDPDDGTDPGWLDFQRVGGTFAGDRRFDFSHYEPDSPGNPYNWNDSSAVGGREEFSMFQGRVDTTRLWWNAGENLLFRLVRTNPDLVSRLLHPNIGWIRSGEIHSIAFLFKENQALPEGVSYSNYHLRRFKVELYAARAWHNHSPQEVPAGLYVHPRPFVHPLEGEEPDMPLNILPGSDDRWRLANPGCDLVVHALIYAERGSFFVVPGDYFDEEARGFPQSADQTDPQISDGGWPRFVHYRRYNQAVRVIGAITANRVEDIASVALWKDKLAYPIYTYDEGAGQWLLRWRSIEMVFDPGFSSNRDRTVTLAPGAFRSDPGANLPRLPMLPTCPGIIYLGGEV